MTNEIEIARMERGECLDCGTPLKQNEGDGWFCPDCTDPMVAIQRKAGANIRFRSNCDK